MRRHSWFVLILFVITAGCGDDGPSKAAPTATTTATAIHTATPVTPATATRTVTAAATLTATTSPSASPTNSATLSPSAKATSTPSVEPSTTPTLSPTASATLSPSAPATATATLSPSAVLPSITPTHTPPESTLTPEPSPSPTATFVGGPFCNLPGSVQSTASGLVIVPGAPANTTTPLNFLHLPVGFCAHYYARMGNPRQLRFAPGGDLFVASPSTFSTGGGPGGQASIVILPDDNQDGVADTNITFLRSLPSTQGLLFANGHLYYQDRTKIRRIPFAPGDRAPTGTSQVVADITVNVSSLHWPKPLDIADDGTIYVGNGADQGDPCIAGHPFKGGILKLDGNPNGTQVAKGFRNPISLRCRRGSNRCYAIELAKDFTGNDGGREKLVPIRDGDDWGFPCCATKDLPYIDVQPVPDCSTVTEDNVMFYVGNTPFDLDFEMGKWPEPWKNRIFVPLHGVYGTWAGARMVSLEFDPASGDLLPGSDIDGMSTGAMRDFATGWGNGTMANGRPGNVAFAPDGRLFLSNDVNGLVIWIAPMELEPPS